MKNRTLYIIGMITFFYAGMVLCPIIGEQSVNASARKGIYTFYSLQAQEKKADSGKTAETTAEKKQGNGSQPVDTKKEKAGTEVAAPYAYEKPEFEESSYGWLIFQMLLVIGCFIAGFYFFFRFITKKTGMASIGRNVVQVMAVSPLGQGKFLQIVDIAGRVLVLGVSENSINLITEISEKDQIDRIKLLSSKSTTETKGFQDQIVEQIGTISQFLKKNIAHKNVSGNRKKFEELVPEPDTDKMEYLKGQKERLKHLNGFHDE